MCFLIDNATEHDLPGIRDIYNHAVRHTTAIWNEHEVNLDNRRQWLNGRLATSFPVLVARDDQGEVIGYATYGPWRPHDGFRYSVEHSVYIHPRHQGKGLGKALMQALITCARRQELHVMVAAIESSNAASITLHRKLGFQISGQMPEVGYKFGRWLDLTFMQLLINPADA